MLKARLISRLISWSNIAFDKNAAVLHVVTIILKRLFLAKMLFPITNIFCVMPFFTFDLGRIGSVGKIPRQEIWLVYADFLSM